MKDIQTLNNPLRGLYNQDLLLCSSWLRRERGTIRRSALCFRYIPNTYQRGEIKTTFTVSSTNLFWAPNQAWCTHVLQPRLGRTGGFSSLEDTTPLWGISKWTDTAMLRPDLPAIPKTVSPWTLRQWSSENPAQHHDGRRPGHCSCVWRRLLRHVRPLQTLLHIYSSGHDYAGMGDNFNWLFWEYIHIHKCTPNTQAKLP